MSAARATRAARHAMPGRLIAGGATAFLIALLVLVIAMAVAGSAPSSTTVGIGGPSLFTSWLLPFSKLVATLATVGCAGALLSAVVLLRLEGGPLGTQGRRAVKDASNAAIIWAIGSLAVATLSAAVLLDTPLNLLHLRFDQALGLPEVKAMLITGILVIALAIGIRRVQTSAAAGLGVLVAITAVIPAAVTAYPRNESYVVWAGAALVLHVIAATTWIGGLAGLVRYGRASRDGLSIVLERFAQVALISSIGVLLSGLVSAVGRLAAKGGGYDQILDALTADGYGALLLAKTAVFLLLILLAATHRRNATADFHDTRAYIFWRIVGTELVVMAIAIGLSVALAQTN